MKKFSKKSVLLFGAVMALCAFAMPSMASAASWGVIGTEHTLDSANLSFTAHSPVLGQITSACAESQFTVNVTNAAALRITTAVFKNCTGTGVGIGDCTVTPVATGFPWTGTGTTTSNIQIDSVNIDVRFETKPGTVGDASCRNLHNSDIRLTGTLNSGVWSGNGANQHSAVFTNATGLTAHSAVGAAVATVTGTIRDTQQTLTLG